MTQLGPKKFLYSPNYFRSGRSASWFTSTCSCVTAMIYFIVTLNTGDETTASNGLWFNKLWWMVVQGATTISPNTTKTTGGDESVWHHLCIWSLTPKARSLLFMTSEYANSLPNVQSYSGCMTAFVLTAARIHLWKKENEGVVTWPQTTPEAKALWFCQCILA